MIYYFCWLNRLISYCFVMSRMYIRKTRLDKDRYDPTSKHNWGKRKCSDRQGSCVSGGGGGVEPLKKNF